MTQLTLLSSTSDDDGSPFDRIRSQRPDESEFWSARDLLDLLEYSTWQKFSPLVEKAKAGAEATGISIDLHFNRTVKTPAGGGPAREDYELSRLACYLVALAADESKPRVAEAKLYFAIKTREAEVREQMSAHEQALTLARALLAADVNLTAANRKIELDAPKVEAYDEYINADGSMLVEEFGKTRGMPGPKLIWGVLVGIGFVRGDKPWPIQAHVNAKRAFLDAHGRIRITRKGQMWLRARLLSGGQDRL